jgi:hypothetical protein
MTYGDSIVGRTRLEAGRVGEVRDWEIDARESGTPGRLEARIAAAGRCLRRRARDEGTDDQHRDAVAGLGIEERLRS